MDKPFCLQNVEEQVDVCYLLTFQSVIVQRQSLVTECMRMVPSANSCCEKGGIVGQN